MLAYLVLWNSQETSIETDPSIDVMFHTSAGLWSDPGWETLWPPF